MTPPPITRRSLLAAGGLALAGGLAGCQDGGDPTPVSTPTEMQRTAPTILFDFDYDPEASTVTITHENGEAATAEYVSLQGEGFADVAGADMTGPGQWAGDVADDGMIRVGHEMTVGVTDAYELRLVWQHPTEDRAYTLGEDVGPEA